jgi:hypothetical protein
MTSISRATIRQHLINQGYSPEQVHAMLVELPQDLDPVRDSAVLEKLGITVDSLLDDRGSGP